MYHVFFVRIPTESGDIVRTARETCLSVAPSIDFSHIDVGNLTGCDAIETIDEAELDQYLPSANMAVINGCTLTNSSYAPSVSTTPAVGAIYAWSNRYISSIQNCGQPPSASNRFLNHRQPSSPSSVYQPAELLSSPSMYNLHPRSSSTMSQSSSSTPPPPSLPSLSSHLSPMEQLSSSSSIITTSMSDSVTNLTNTMATNTNLLHEYHAQIPSSIIDESSDNLAVTMSSDHPNPHQLHHNNIESIAYLGSHQSHHSIEMASHLYSMQNHQQQQHHQNHSHHINGHQWSSYDQLID